MNALVRYCVELVRNNAEEISGPRPSLPARAGSADVVHIVRADLPRCCAVHNRLYMAPYVLGADGHFHLGQTFALTKRVYQNQYAENRNMVTVPDCDIEPEECPCCGACPPDGYTGAVRCGRCGLDVCFGLTVGKLFRCRSSCGACSEIVRKPLAYTGLAPSWQR